MTRKHFRAIADYIAKIECMKKPEKLDIAIFLCCIFREINERFDNKKFIEACVKDG